MLDPSEIPQFTGNLEELDKDAAALKKGAGHIRDGGADIHAKFQGLSAPYHAPEAEKLFATTLPVRDKAKDFGDDLEKVAAALTAYAGEVKPLAEKLKSLKAEAERFVESVKGDKDWAYDKKKTDHQKRIRSDIDETVAAFYDAERAAANKITALVKDGTKWIADDGSHKKGMYGFKAEDLKHAKVPWGQPEDQKHHWYEVGHWVKSFVWDGLIIDGVVGTVKGLGTLVGFDGWDAMKNAWKGLGMLAVGVAAYSIPSVRMIPDSMLPQFVKDSKKVAREAGKAMVAWDEWGKNPARAAGAVTFNVLTTITGAGNVAKAGTAAKVAGVAGKVGRVIDPMTYVGKGLGAGFQGVKVAVPKVGELMSGLRTSLGGTHAIPASFTMPGDMPSAAVPGTHGVTAASYHPTAEGAGTVPASFHGSADVPATAPSAPHTASPASYGGAADTGPAPASHGSAPAPAPHSPAPDAPGSSPSSHSSEPVSHGSAADAPAKTPTPHHEAPKAHDTPPTVMPDNSVRFWDGTTLHENGTMETPVGKPHEDPIPVELSAADRAAHQKLEASFPAGDGPGVPHGGHPSDRPAGDGTSVPHEDKPVLASVGAGRATADAAAHVGHVGENTGVKLHSDLNTPHEQPAHANAGGTPAEATGRTTDNTPRASHEPPTGSGTGGGHTPTHTSGGGGGGHDLPSAGRGGESAADHSGGHPPAGPSHDLPSQPGHDLPSQPAHEPPGGVGHEDGRTGEGHSAAGEGDAVDLERLHADDRPGVMSDDHGEHNADHWGHYKGEEVNYAEDPVEEGLKVLRFYEAMRDPFSSRGNVETIADNTDLDPSVVQTAKQNLFLDRHDVETERGVTKRNVFFTPDAQIMDLWKKAEAGTLSEVETRMFRNHVAHEYVENKLMELGMTYRSNDPRVWGSDTDYLRDRSLLGAHDVAPNALKASPLVTEGIGALSHWTKMGIEPPTTPILDDLSNVDELVQVLRKEFNL